ncbi:MAG: DUF58 domain-containing protein [Sulfurovum sp.]|nr:DUF58 domain-containing protein [Sulfurovum sp.]
MISAQLREYQIGDDIRKINWTITAKLGKPYIKEFHANRELSVVVCALLDGGMYFAKGNQKQEKLSEVASIIGYLTEQNSDLYTGIAYSQSASIETLPTKQLYLIEQFTQALYTAPLLGTKLEYNDAIAKLFKRLIKPSLVFVIGDFLEEVDLSILAQKHEVIAIIIRDKAEESPAPLGEVTLHNTQNHSEKETYFGKKAIQQYQAKLQAHFIKYDIRSVKIFTDEEVVLKLLKLFV